MSTDTLHTIDTGALMRAEWMSRRDDLIDEADCITVVENQAHLNLAGAVISDAANHRKALDTARKTITREIDALKRSIMDQEKALVADLTAEENRLRALSKEYLTELDRIRREAEAEAEIKRRQDAEAQLEKEQAARSAFGAGVEIAAPVPDAIPMPPPPPTRPSTAGTRKSWKFEVTDPARLERCYMVTNDKAIRSAIRAMADQGLEPQIDGLRIWSEIDVRARG